MTRTERLQPLVRHKEQQEQQALQEVARSQGVLEIEQSRLAQLEQYKSEYLHKKQQDLKLYSALEMQEFNRFLEQLDQTIVRQQEVIRQREQELESKRKLWDATRIESRVMHKAVEKLQLQETREQARSEQKELDDITQTNFHLRRK